MKLEHDRTIEFSRPIRQIVSMVVVLILVAVGVFFLYSPIKTVFEANAYLNGFIGGVFVIGVMTSFWQVISLIRSVNWIDGFAIDRPGLEFVEPPRLLASLSALLRDRRARASLTATSTRSILDSVATRLDELRDITRYITNLLILVGLLGTFWGLSQVVPGIVQTMRDLQPQPGQEGLDVFSNLMAGLNDQLDGMGTAFASSLLGLAGSLVVGLLDLFAGHGANRFYRELEEWLSSITRISLASDDGAGGADAYMVDLMDRNIAQIEQLTELFRAAEEQRHDTDARIDALTDGLSSLVGRMGQAAFAAPAAAAGAPAAVPGPQIAPEQLDRLVRTQERLAAALERRRGGEDGEEDDAETRMRMRNIDVQLLRILEEISAGRQESTAELRADLMRLTKAVIALGQPEGR